MIKTIFISAGLIGFTAFGGMALSMAHDLAFTQPQAVQGETLQQVAFSQPQPGSAEAEILSGGAVASTPLDQQAIPAILESTGPYNRLAGKSIATASANAPAMVVRPVARISSDDNRIRRDVSPSIVAPVFARQSLDYVPSTPRATVAPVATPVRATVAEPATPTPSFLVGVYR